jgi:hypothetical protein
MLFRAHDPLLHGSMGNQPIPSGSFWERLGAEHYGSERQETVESHAEGIVAEELKRRRWGGARIGTTRQRGRGQRGHVGAVAGGDGGEGEMDNGAIADGSAGLC